MDPMLVAIGGTIVALAAVVIVAGVFRPEPGRWLVGGSRSRGTRSHEAEAETQAEIEAVDIDQMIDARSERRRLAGRPDIGDELAREALRRAPEDSY
jgi:hypothetical protein